MKKSLKRIILLVNIVIAFIFVGCADKAVAAQIASTSTISKKAAENVAESTSQNVAAKEMIKENSEVVTPKAEIKDSEPPLVQGDDTTAAYTTTVALGDSISENSILPSDMSVSGNEMQKVEGQGLEVNLVNKHYACDVLKAKDFHVKVTKTDGEILINPLGWNASPLELVEGENKITIIYQEYITTITVNADKRPEAVVVEEKNDNSVQPVTIVNKEAFAVSGSSVLKETSDMGQEYLDKIIFLGDSRTYSYKAYGVLSGGKKTKQVWTPKSGTMTLSSQGYAMISYPETGKDITIREAVMLKKPEYMIIGLGTNGISFMDEEDFRNEYFSLINDIKDISPDTKIIINSIFPIANYYKRLDLINNEKIAKANGWLVKIAEETGVKFLNTAEALADKDGWLNISYDNGGEATHLNKQGNEIVMRYIRTHGYQ